MIEYWPECKVCHDRMRSVWRMCPLRYGMRRNPEVFIKVEEELEFLKEHGHFRGSLESWLK